MKIAYCIHSLHLFGGIERVLSIKANYLADVYGYDIHIITADQKERPVHFHLSDRITLHDVGTSEKFMLHTYGRKLNRILCEIRPDICVSVGGRDIFCLPDCTDGSIKSPNSISRTTNTTSNTAVRGLETCTRSSGWDKSKR